MTLKSGFFNADGIAEGKPDRVYLAEDFARYFASFIGNGVFPNPSTNFQVYENTGTMQAKVMPGSCWINGYFGYDDDFVLLDIEPADGVLNRIDNIVLRLDFKERLIKLLVKRGEVGTQPTPPALQRDADAYEMSLAYVSLNKGITEITQSMIQDNRQNSDLCGLVTGVVEQIDTSTFMIQLETWKQEYIQSTNTWTDEQKRLFDEWVLNFETESEEWKNNQEQIFIQWSDGQKTRFDEWFGRIKGQLSVDAAGNLQLQIDDMKNGEVEGSLQNQIDKLVNEPVEVILEAEKWQGKIYSLEDIYPAEKYDFLMTLKFGQSDEVKKAWGLASINGGDTTSNRVEANGIVPTVDIVVILKYIEK